MEIDENSYILGYWFASDGENNWYLLMIKKDGKWIGQQTFRYNKNGSDPFLGEDEKSISEITIDGSRAEDEVIDTIEKLFELIKKTYSDYSDYFLVRGNAGKFMKIAKDKEYINFKAVN